MHVDFYFAYKSLPIPSIINGIVAKPSLRFNGSWPKIPHKCPWLHERTSL